MLRSLLRRRKEEEKIVELDEVEYYTASEFSTIMHRHITAVYEWMREDKIPHVGTLIPKKRVDILRKIAAYLSEDVTTVYGWIRGRFIEDDEIEDYIRKRITKNRKRHG